MSLLEIDNASVYYEDFQALYDINIKIEEGEIFACIGANGAGKSTMLKTVAGVLVPRRGRILFDGQPIDHMPPYKRVELGISLRKRYSPQRKDSWIARGVSFRSNHEMSTLVTFGVWLWELLS